MITFTTFHVENEQTDSKAEVKANVVSKNIYHVLLELLFRSASLFHPGCKKVILSNQTTKFHGLNDQIEIFRADVDDGAPLMYSRLTAQIEYIDGLATPTNLVFLDADILINANLTALFEQEFDIALTYRADQDMPINWGVMFVSTQHQGAASQFLKQVLEQYRNQYFTNPIFWCDQYALIDTIGRDRFFNRTSDRLEINGVKILLVPCATYNFSPENHARSILSELKDKKIIHFKGARKRFIQSYWQTYLEWREPPVAQSWLPIFYNRSKLFSAAIAESLKPWRSRFGKVLAKAALS